MKIIRSPEAMQREIQRLKRRGKRIGFVPTMGALHAGHLSLINAARRENNIVVASIFVNPTQFGPKEDLKKYPRPFARDCRLLREAKVDYLFYPSAAQMYPKGFSVAVDFNCLGAQTITNVLCGKFRPGHFSGVATVVLKLFNIVLPDRAYFGAKDYQQCVVIQQMIRDLNLAIDLRIRPTIRESDGLAMSSRNQYLNPKDRERAAVISQTLFWVKRKLESRNRDLKATKREALWRLRQTVDSVQYFEIVHPETLKNLEKARPKMVVMTACFVGKTRLIDNVIIHTQKSADSHF